MEPFGHLIDQVMRREPYVSARRLFIIVDGGCSRHGSTELAEVGSTFPKRLAEQYPNAVAVNLPTRADLRRLLAKLSTADHARDSEAQARPVA